jgi:hypothetical protein
MCPWISWWVCHHQGDLMQSWWWWIDLTRWHNSFPLRKVPCPKRQQCCFSPMCLSIMASPRTLCRIKTQSSQASFSEWKCMGLKLKMGTSFRPQTDGQTNRMNLVIQQFLRNYVASNQQDWVDHLELAKFCYNNSEHLATRATLF